MEQELVKKAKKRQALIDHNTDFAMLEEFINDVNENPDLVITMTTRDGTKLEFRSERKQRNKTMTEILGEMNG